jgi:hypothetical protein
MYADQSDPGGAVVSGRRRLVKLESRSVHLWTQEEGQSDLTVQLAFVETTHHTFDVEVLGFRVAPPNHRPRSSPQPRERRPRTPSQRQPLLGDPIPKEWRSTFERLVHRLVIGDYAGLARDGVVSATSGPDDDSIGTWIERYPLDADRSSGRGVGILRSLPDRNGASHLVRQA